MTRVPAAAQPMPAADSWQGLLASFRGRAAPGAWNLTRATVANDLEAVVLDPDSIDQGAFGFCGIAAFLRFWAKRDPRGLMAFAVTVYEQGAAAFSSYRVDPNRTLRERDYAADRAHHGTRCPAGQWMVMAAIQDSISVAGFDGSIDRSWHAFLSLHEGAIPSQIATLLRHSRCYRTVDNRTDWAAVLLPRSRFLPSPWKPDIGDVTALSPGAGCDVVLQINDLILHGSNPVPPGLVGEIADDFPNHFVALASRPRVSAGRVSCRVWTWAAYQDLDLTVDRFLANYYGAVVCTV
jgi:hypothetical protein